MAAADLVVALPGAVTCAEARVVGRQLLLLDVMPGHGRDNLLHELELGGAHACVMTPQGVTASVLALRDEDLSQTPLAPPAPAPPAPVPSAPVPSAMGWEPALVAALQRIDLDLHIENALIGAGSR